MKIKLYTIPGCGEADKIRGFLHQNILPFEELVVDSKQAWEEFRKICYGLKVSTLKVTYSSSIGVMHGFNDVFMQQLAEHVKKYNPKFK